MRIVMAQIEPRTGDLDGNTKQILDVIAANGDADLIVFPELAVTGYNCGALFESTWFVGDAMSRADRIIHATTGIHATVVFGNVRFADEPREKSGVIRLHNSAIVARSGECLGHYDKILLANDAHHEDRHYFIPGERFLTFSVACETVGVLICEDIWACDHDRNLVEELKTLNPDLSQIVCLNYSYYTFEKQAKRHALLSGLSARHKVGITYVNAVGIGDISKNFILYDGSSVAFSPTGELIEALAGFHTCVSTIDTQSYLPLTFEPQSKNLGLWSALTYFNRAIFQQLGIPKAQVHVSGGLDSALVAVLCAKSVGPENCVFISNPSKDNGEVTKGNAQYIADKLGVTLHWMPVEELVRAGQDALEKPLPYPRDVYEADDHPAMNPMVNTTLQAVGRSVIGLSACHHFKSAIVATGNHTENILGWFTFHDVGSIGLYQPLGDLTKTELFSLAEWVNKHYGEELIPKGLYDGSIKPAAELADSKEDPFDYYLYSGICAEIIRRRCTPRELSILWDTQALEADSFPDAKTRLYEGYTKDVFMAAAYDAYQRSQRSVFKSAQSAPLVILAPRSRGFSARETILNFYRG